MLNPQDHANLLTFRLNDGIEPAATFGLHESVARLRPGSLAPASSSPEVLRPDLIFATANGRLGMVGELGTSATRTLDDLQRNMNKYHKGPGGLDWRA
jgi:DNA damage-binding protein 1